MHRFSVAARLWFMIALFAGVILVGTLIGLGGTRFGVKATEEMYLERTLPSQLMSEVQGLMLDSRLEIAAALQTPRDEVIQNTIRVVGENRAKIENMYDARFFRMWEFYLAGGIVMFESGAGCNYQVQYIRDRHALPITRDYMLEAEKKLRMKPSASKKKGPAPKRRTSSSSKETEPA